MYIPGPIPIVIHPIFWLFAALIGFMSTGEFAGTLIWVGIIFFSVLIHEFGHALTAALFKQKPRIQLIALGGVTTYEAGPPLKFWQNFLIVLNGPLFGFALFFLSGVLLKSHLFTAPLVLTILTWTQYANFFWSALNLFPVLPLDGGQLLRIVLEGIFGVKGFRASLLIGASISLMAAGLAFLIHYFLVGAFFFLFSYQSFDAWRKARKTTGSDRDESNRALLLRGEAALEAGDKGEARRTFEQLRTKAKEGLLAITASQYLAFLDFDAGNKEEAYTLLLSIKDQLADESICFLHQLADEHQNAQVVAELSTRCYQVAPSQEVALRNAAAFARLKNPEAAGGWLETAWEHGPFPLEKLVAESPFSLIRNEPLFKEFIDSLLKKTARDSKNR